MKQNHFIYSYAGNKRNEAEAFIEKANFENIEDIIEPFCGTSAISFTIWLKYGDQFKYHLNDNNKNLVEVYRTLKSKPIEAIEDAVNEIGKNIQNKNDWNDYLKAIDNESVYKYIFFCKYSRQGRYGFYDLEQRYKRTFKTTDIQKQFIKFIQSPNVFISFGEWIDTFNQYKDNMKSMFILDPPYINTCNDFYIEKNLNVYEYFFNNKNETYKCKIYLVLEDIWIIRMLFNNYQILLQYDKKYSYSKRDTKHIILSNN